MDNYRGFKAESGINSAYAAETSAPTSEPLLESLNSRLDSQLSGTHEAYCRVRAIADRLFGPQPEAVGENKASPSPQSSIARLARTRENFDSVLNDLLRQIQRLEAL